MRGGKGQETPLATSSVLSTTPVPSLSPDTQQPLCQWSGDSLCPTILSPLTPTCRPHHLRSPACCCSYLGPPWVTGGSKRGVRVFLPAPSLLGRHTLGPHASWTPAPSGGSSPTVQISLCCSTSTSLPAPSAPAVIQVFHCCESRCLGGSLNSASNSVIIPFISLHSSHLR